MFVGEISERNRAVLRVAGHRDGRPRYLCHVLCHSSV